MPKYWGKLIFSLGRFPEVGQKQKTEREKKKRILQGLGVGPGSVTERWPCRKTRENQRPNFCFWVEIMLHDENLFPPIFWHN